MAATMQAMVTMGHGDLDVIQWQENWPKPQPAAGEVLVRVGACGLNNTDVNTRSGGIPRPYLKPLPVVPTKK